MLILYRYLTYNFFFLYLYKYNSTVRVYVNILLLNSWTVLNEIGCVRLSGSLKGLDSQLDPLSPTWGGAQIGIKRLTMESLV